jgi:hypothetical protein
VYLNKHKNKLEIELGLVLALKLRAPFGLIGIFIREGLFRM